MVLGISLSSLAAIAVLIVFNCLLGFFVIARNSKGTLNRMFLTMTLAVTLWAVASSTSDATTSLTVARATAKLAFGAGFFAVCSGYFFSEVFRRGRLQRRFSLILLAVLLLSVLYCTPLVYRLRSLDSYQNGPLYIPYILTMLLAFGLIVRNMYAVLRHGDAMQRTHARFIMAGIASTVILAMVTNVIVPAVTEVTWVTKLGPLFTVLLVGSVAYTMIRHRLFDMRLAVARTLAYVFTLIVIASVYSILLIGVLSHFIDMQYASWVQQFAYVAMAVVLSSTFQPLKKFFDRLTNRLFYQDAYDAQELYGQLNKVLVSSLDVKYLMMQSISIIETALKPDFALVGLRDGSDAQRIFASRKLNFKQEDISKLRTLTPRVRHKVIVADDIDNSKQTELKELLRHNNIAVVVRLSQNVRSGEEGFGYLLLGNKKSGNPYTQADVRVLDTVANELIIAVQNALHYEEIQQFNLVLQDRVDDATRKLRRTNEKLKALDETKDDFISMASHQLRTPLTSIKGYLSMVLEGDAGKINETQRKMLGQSFVSSQRMVYLIADLLNVSRLKTGKFVIEATPTNLADMVSEEIDQLVETAAARDIELTYKQPKHFPDLQLDETKTRQVIMNFVDNAIYYTPSGGHIQVQLEDTPTSVELKVVDDGIGVPKHEQHHLFSKFYRAGNAQKARPDGTGLGLFMAKKVILAQGGSIIFESKEGKGSTFGFLFPKNHKPHAAPAKPIAVAEEKATVG